MINDQKEKKGGTRTKKLQEAKKNGELKKQKRQLAMQLTSPSLPSSEHYLIREQTPENNKEQGKERGSSSSTQHTLLAVCVWSLRVSRVVMCYLQEL